MIDGLQDLEPLSQVRFVHNYIQLLFQEEIVTIINIPELHLPNGEVLARNAVGFCDALVGQIDQRLADTDLKDGCSCTFTFANGVKLVVPLTSDAARGPEAVELPHAYIVFNA